MDRRALPLLALIRSVESDSAAKPQGVASAYDVVWGGIKAQDRPPRPLTQMTVAEVLAWQDSIDRRYNSEAAGAYQIMEDTLRDLVKEGAADLNERFDEATQDRLAFALLRRRGWDSLVRGTMNATGFGNSIAREWASLPVHTVQQGAKRQVQPGVSYYSGDGLNKAHTTRRAVIDALMAPPPPEDTPAPTPAPDGALEARVAALEAKLAAMAAALT